jgi:hypothetical protein
MKKILPVLILLSLIYTNADAQFWQLRRLEFATGTGITQFYGDIGGYSRGKNMIGIKDFSFHQTRFNVNMNIRYRVIDNVSARINFDYGAYHSTDARGSNEGRGYEATTRFFEHVLIGEYYYLRNKGENSFLMQKGKKLPLSTFISMLDCYALTGIGVVSYKVKPNASLASKTTNTSGLAAVIPIGIGVNFNYSSDFNIGAELSGRYAFTDYLDGYSSQYSERNDIYVFLNFSLIYKIKTDRGKKGF